MDEEYIGKEKTVGKNEGKGMVVISGRIKKRKGHHGCVDGRQKGRGACRGARTNSKLTATMYGKKKKKRNVFLGVRADGGGWGAKNSF